MEFLGFIIGLFIGLSGTLFITSFGEWSKWESLGVIYSNYEWRLLQRRTKSNGAIQFREILIQKYGTLSPDIIAKIENK